MTSEVIEGRAHRFGDYQARGSKPPDMYTKIFPSTLRRTYGPSALPTVTNKSGAMVVLPLHAQCCFKGAFALLIPLGREIASVGFSGCLTAFECERERIAILPHSALQWYWTMRSPGGIDASLEGLRGRQHSPQEVCYSKEHAYRVNLSATRYEFPRMKLLGCSELSGVTSALPSP